MNAYDTGANGGYRLNKDVTGRVPTEDLHQFASDSKVLSRLNTWIGDIADRETLQFNALEQLYRKSRTSWNRI